MVSFFGQSLIICLNAVLNPSYPSYIAVFVSWVLDDWSFIKLGINEFILFLRSSSSSINLSGEEAWKCFPFFWRL